MKTNKVTLTAALAAAVLTTAALAQSPAAPSPAAPAAPNEVVYVGQLPKPSDLTASASAQGMTVEQINQTANDVTVTFKTASGQTQVIDYKPLSEAEGDTGAAVAPASGGPAVAPTTTTTTVYYDGPAYYPYSYYPYYGPWGWYAPVGVRLGIGFGFHGGGGFHGHFR